MHEKITLFAIHFPNGTLVVEWTLARALGFFACLGGLLLLLVSQANAALSASSCASKVAADYHTRTGLTMASGSFNAIQDMCQGIIDEIKADAVVTTPAGVAVSTTGGPTAQTGATTANGIGTVQ